MGHWPSRGHHLGNAHLTCCFHAALWISSASSHVCVPVFPLDDDYNVLQRVAWLA